MTLAELRKAFPLTQDTLARNLNVKQAEISKIENRAEAMNENVHASFGGGCRVHQSSRQGKEARAGSRLTSCRPSNSAWAARSRSKGSRWACG